MKTKTALLVAVSALSIFFFSCKKQQTDVDPTPAADTAFIAHWSIEGINYKGQNPSWSKMSTNNSGPYSIVAQAQSGDTTILFYVQMPYYLMTGNNIMLYSTPFDYAFLTSGAVLNVVKQVGSTYDAFYTSSSGWGDVINCTDLGNEYRLTCNNIHISRVGYSEVTQLSCDVIFKKPQIPVANQVYTIPPGIQDNKYIVDNNQSYLVSGGNNFTITNYGCFMEASLLPGKVTYHFSQTLPPSGTYDIIPSYTDLKPGQIFIQFENPSPTTSEYNAEAGGTATVVTTGSSFSVTISNIAFDKYSVAGTPVVHLTGNSSF